MLHLSQWSINLHAQHFDSWVLTQAEQIELVYFLYFRKGEIEKVMKTFFPSSLPEREQLSKCVKHSTEKDQLQHQQLLMNMEKRKKHI